MNLSFTELPKTEIVHYADKNWLITSIANCISVNSGECIRRFSLPQHGWKRFVLGFRLFRRPLRLDKCNVVPILDGQELVALIAIRQGSVYRIDIPSGEIEETFQLKLCRNLLHQSICTSKSGYLFFGEYGGNPQRNAVPVLRSTDSGRSWEKIFEFPKASIKHVHGCYWDRYEEKVWVCTGDFENENCIIVADENFEKVEHIGDGSQVWRTCFPFFLENSVIWAMDSQLEASYICKLDRKTRSLTRLQEMPGPVWYAKDFSDGKFILATANEIGEGVKDEYSHICVSSDAENWEHVMKIRHDGLPKRYFKFGVIGFADGSQTSKKFYLFVEALKGMDGKAYCCSLSV